MCHLRPIVGRVLGTFCRLANETQHSLSHLHMCDMQDRLCVEAPARSTILMFFLQGLRLTTFKCSDSFFLLGGGRPLEGLVGSENFPKRASPKFIPGGTGFFLAGWLGVNLRFIGLVTKHGLLTLRKFAKLAGAGRLRYSSFSFLVFLDAISLDR